MRKSASDKEKKQGTGTMCEKNISVVDVQEYSWEQVNTKVSEGKSGTDAYQYTEQLCVIGETHYCKVLLSNK